MKYLVIFFVSLLTQSAMAQTDGRIQAPVPTFESKDQEKAFLDELEVAIKTSNAFVAVNNDTHKGGELKPNKKMLKDMATSSSSVNRWIETIEGNFTLAEVSNNGEINISETGDTVLSVVMTDLSVWGHMKTDATKKDYWTPTTVADDNKIIKGYSPISPKGGEGEASEDLNASIMGTLKSVDENATYVWLKKDTAFIATMNGKQYFFQKKDGTFVTTDPEAPVVYDLGNTGLFGLGRKMKVLYGKDADGNPVGVSNVNNANKRGLGMLAGFNSSGYGNNRPWFSSPVYYNNPMWGGGWNNYGYGGGYGYGNGGCGFSAGLSVNFVWGSSCGYANNNFCQPSYGGVTTRVWNFSTRRMGQADWLGSGVGYSAGNYGGGYYDDGYGGWKSNVTSDNPAVETEEFYDIASADVKVSSTSNNKLSEVETFYDLKSEDLMASSSKTMPETKEGRTDSHTANQKVPSMKLPASHSSTSGRTANNSGAKPVENNRVSIKLPPSHGATKPVKPAGTSNDEFASTIGTRRQGNNSVQVVPDTKPGNDSRKPRFDGENNQIDNTTHARTTREVKPSRETNQRSLEMAENQRRIEAEQARRAEEAQMRQMDQTRGQRYQQPRPGPNAVRTSPPPPAKQPNVSAPPRTQQRSAPPMRPTTQPQRQAPQQKGQSSGRKGR